MYPVVQYLVGTYLTVEPLYRYQVQHSAHLHRFLHKARMQWEPQVSGKCSVRRLQPDSLPLLAPSNSSDNRYELVEGLPGILYSYLGT